jgi:hypothetical protein
MKTKAKFGATLEPQDPPSEQLQRIINFYTQGQLQQALSESSQLLERFPNSVILYNIAGACRFDAIRCCYQQLQKGTQD